MAKRKAAGPSSETLTSLSWRVAPFSDPTRLHILHLLESGPKSVGEVVEMLNTIAQPTVSHHLSLLNRAGLVDRIKEGRHVHYQINPANVAATLRDVAAVAGVRM